MLIRFRQHAGKAATALLLLSLPLCLANAQTEKPVSKSYDGKVMVLQKAKRGKGIDIVLLGDAFVQDDLVPGGPFETWIKEAGEALFFFEPMKTMREYFNVYAVKAVSESRIYAKDEKGETSTRFGANPKNLRETRWNICIEYSRKAPLRDPSNFFYMVFTQDLRPSQARHRLFSPKEPISCSAASIRLDKYGKYNMNYMRNIIAHELVGHGIGGLWEEYVKNEGEPTLPLHKRRKAPNIDYTNNPDSVRWSAFLKNKDYKDQVGIYEGGGRFAKGVWRPSKNSIMRNLKDGFNAPSREAIYRNIKKLAGEEYSFEEFLLYDKRNIK